MTNREDLSDTSVLLAREAELQKEKATRIKSLFTERAACESRIKAIGEELKALGHKRARTTKKAKGATQQ